MHGPLFLLNDRVVRGSESPGLLVLDYLRRTRRLTGTKEGCKEGDCGACMVLVGDLQPDGRIAYQPETSCLIPLGELQGRHLVTIEGLDLDSFGPVQEAILEHGASQCGYCTPGIVVSLTGLLLDPRKPIDEDGVKYALGGNLCRCTGYRSLKNVGRSLADRLSGGLDGDRVESLVRAGALPGWFLDAPGQLRELTPTEAPPDPPSAESDRLRIAGGTDLYVQQGERIPGTAVDLLRARPELAGIRIEGGRVRVGALTTFEAFGTNPGLVALLPKLPHWLHLMASWQIRNRATLGGNLVNASPIGDMTSLLCALDADLILDSGTETRRVPLREFFLDYKVTALREDEIVAHIEFDAPGPDEHVHWEKVSKRTCLDIATVNTGIRLGLRDGVVDRAVLSLGGVAAVPFFARRTAAFLEGRPIRPPVLSEALQVLDAEISPISDVRGSAAYKRLLARQLVLAHFVELFDIDALEVVA